ncbi:hypothetical protein CDCA_CDCA04G1318 [Cyanidium caldarium]|uniref:DNA ligase n=1 Tax=Cyanidium caldarium TaxID=2771 RepID=A0AAV9ITW5_CYACA|nr:hypothetical protein CDCA_CDCA04G1318 [Cyanidium caldarium]
MARGRQRRRIVEDEDNEEELVGQSGLEGGVDTEANAQPLVAGTPERGDKVIKRARQADITELLGAYSPKAAPGGKSEAVSSAVQEANGSSTETGNAAPAEDGDVEARPSQTHTATKRTCRSRSAAVGTAETSEADDTAASGLFTALATSDLEPRAATTWSAGTPVPYAFLAAAFERMSNTMSRIELTQQLCDAFRCIMESTPEDLLPAVYLVINRLAPAHEGLEIGVGDALLLQALAAATGRKLALLKEQYRQTGDLGDVAAHSRTTQRTMFSTPPLTVRGVYHEFLCIARASGRAMQEEKKRRIQKLLVSAKELEAKFLARALQGKLRIRLADKTVITALAAAFVWYGDAARGHAPPAAVRIESSTLLLKRVYNECPSWNRIIDTLLQLRDIDERLAEHCRLTPGLPVLPMLAKPCKSVAEVLTRLEGVPFSCEYKYDGERAQIHRVADGRFHIYSRNCEDHTGKYPDLAAQLPRALRAALADAQFILDAEVVAYDRDAKRTLPFQQIQHRARKNVLLDDIKTRVCLFAFDLLYLDGRSLTRCPLAERRRLLRDTFQVVPGEFMFAESSDLIDGEHIQEFMDEAMRHSCEGLMVKALDGAHSTYEPANRTQNWLKLKKDYLSGVGDTLDLVPIGAYYGRGKRVGWFGSYLLACYNADTETFEAVTKVGTGFSEEQLAELYQQHSTHVLEAPRPYYAYSEQTRPDVWLETWQVWEIQCADLSLSPAYLAGMSHVQEGKGISVRFPRLVRIRNDKESEEATTSEQLVEMYVAQFQHATRAEEEEGSEAVTEDEEGDA